MRWLVTVVVVAGCATPAAPEAPDAGDDEVRVDAAPICVPNATVCDDLIDIYVECDGEGVPAVAIECPLGCAKDVERCFDVVASNGLTQQLDEARDRADVKSVTFAGAATIDTDTGVVRVGDAELAVPTTVIGGIRVLLFRYVTILGTVKIRGSLPVALIADGDVEIIGLLDVSADHAIDGPGAVTTGPCVGMAGGGGGHATPGAIAGAAFDGSMIAIAGVATPAPAIVPLHGGCRAGGGGGGALQIVSRRTIAITNGGRIDASGGGGPGDGTGGGAGGSLLLEAADIVVVAGAISTKGGGGAGAASPGSDGGTGQLAAQGGAQAGFAQGGAGGTATTAPSAGAAGNATHPMGGGGGGAVGEARFNDRDGVVTLLDGAAIRSRYTEELVGSRLTP